MRFFTFLANLLSAGRGMAITLILLCSLAFLFMIPQLVENLDAKEVMIIQMPLSGELIVYTEPGWKWQGFGKVTTYPRRDQFSFSAVVDQGKAVDESIQTRFNDGGHGNISGTINWAMPLTPDKIIRIHKDFGGFQAIEQQLIRPSLQKIIYNVGPTMSSTESSAEKRPEIPKYIDDQLVHGPYLTKVVQQTQKDPITGQDKQVNVVTIAMDEKGKPVREAISQVSEYGLQLQPVSINNIKYDAVVENQIKERQTATTQVQISIANAKKAEQDAVTIAKQGEAAAAKAKWEQETENAKFIALAEKDKKVAELNAQAAEQIKRKLILEGEGEAAKRRLVMEADGALDKKLATFEKVNGAYATAISSYGGAWVPSVVMGERGGNSGGNGATALIDMLTAKTAKDLGLEMTIPHGKGTSRK